MFNKFVMFNFGINMDHLIFDNKWAIDEATSFLNAWISSISSLLENTIDIKMIFDGQGPFCVYQTFEIKQDIDSNIFTLCYPKYGKKLFEIKLSSQTMINMRFIFNEIHKNLISKNKILIA